MRSETLANAEPATERKTLADVRGTHIRAEPRPKAASVNLRAVAADARHSTMKLKTAADAIGLSEPRLSHKFSDGTVTLKELEAFGLDYVEEFSRLLSEKCKTNDPKARARRLINEGRRVLDELAEVL